MRENNSNGRKSKKTIFPYWHKAGKYYIIYSSMKKSDKIIKNINGTK